jgi:Putative beta-barrel porin-2, OmpL-like. bbp2
LIHPSLRAFVAIVFGAGVAVGAGTAQAATHDATQAPTSVAQPEAAAPAPTSTPQTVDFHGSADVGFTRIQAPGVLTGRVFQSAQDQNSPTLQNIYLGTTLNTPQFGAEFDVSLGNDADVIAPFETNTTPAGGSRNKGWDITQAYITHKCEKTGGWLSLGKFEELSGIEKIEAAKDWNYSRSILFGVNPYSETGVRAGWSANDKVKLTLGETLGWNQIKETSQAGAATNLRTSEASLWIKSSANTDVKLTANIGAAQDDQLGAGSITPSPINGLPLTGIRRSYDAVVTGKVAKHLKLAANYDYGQQDNVVLFDNNGLPTGVGQARWQGGAAYANYHFNQKWSGTLRAELFRDTGGFTTGADQKWAEQTATVQYAWSEPLLLRLEYRNDDSDQSVFGRGPFTNMVKFQHTLAAEAIVRY